MAKDGLINSPFENPTVPTPSAGDGTTIGVRGGADWPMEDNSKQGLAGTPYDNPACPPPSGKETANASELGTLPYTTDVKDGPAPWSTVAVEPGVASPAVPAGNIDKK
jgi:hypothetical protein